MPHRALGTYVRSTWNFYDYDLCVACAALGLGTSFQLSFENNSPRGEIFLVKKIQITAAPGTLITVGAGTLTFPGTSFAASSVARVNPSLGKPPGIWGEATSIISLPQAFYYVGSTLGEEIIEGPADGEACILPVNYAVAIVGNSSSGGTVAASIWYLPIIDRHAPRGQS